VKHLLQAPAGSRWDSAAPAASRAATNAGPTVTRKTWRSGAIGSRRAAAVVDRRKAGAVAEEDGIAARGVLLDEEATAATGALFAAASTGPERLESFR